MTKVANSGTFWTPIALYVGHMGHMGHMGHSECFAFVLVTSGSQRLGLWSSWPAKWNARLPPGGGTGQIGQQSGFMINNIW